MKNHQLFIYFICLVSAMGGLLFGYDWVVIGGAKPFYEEYFHIAGDEGMQALTMSIALLGCLLGATMAGFLADRYGRKKLLVLSAFIFFASSWATGAATAIPAFIIARLVGGMAIGLAADLSPMYIAEVAPTQIRGKLRHIEPADHRIGNSWRTDCKYADCRAGAGRCYGGRYLELMERTDRMALDVLGRMRSFGTLFPAGIVYSRKPALAGQHEADGES